MKWQYEFLLRVAGFSIGLYFCYLFGSMTIDNTESIQWLPSFTYAPVSTYLFLLMLIFGVCGFGYYLWRRRGGKERDSGVPGGWKLALRVAGYVALCYAMFLGATVFFDGYDRVIWLMSWERVPRATYFLIVLLVCGAVMFSYNRFRKRKARVAA